MKFLAVILGILVCSCGPDFKVGPTKFIIAENAEVWDDLPEAVNNMQLLEDVPFETWNMAVFLQPGYRGRPNIACQYSWVGGGADIIIARTVDQGPATGQSCLPHEFAHRWHHMDLGDVEFEKVAKINYHDKDFLYREAFLRASAIDTWLGRQFQPQ